MIVKKIIEALEEKRLSKNELEVFLLVLAGYSNEEIADMRCICIKSVKAHKTAISNKIGYFGHNAIHKFTFKALYPSLKHEIYEYIYPDKIGNLLPLGKLGED